MEKQHALLWNAYMNLLEENQDQKTIILERDETIARLRRALIKYQNQVARLEQMISPDLFLATSTSGQTGPSLY